MPFTRFTRRVLFEWLVALLGIRADRAWPRQLRPRTAGQGLYDHVDRTIIRLLVKDVAEACRAKSLTAGVKDLTERSSPR